MACYHPLAAYQLADKSIVFSERAGANVLRSLQLPCGQCVGCRLERSRQWAVRCVHEASQHAENAFITLTYDDEHLPADWSLEYGDYQRFMKRLRKRFGPVRFYMAGEYGEQFGRPHYHACLFGFNFPDRQIWKKSQSGMTIYRSAALEELWPFGYSSIGDVTFESAAYVARYIMKKVTGRQAESHYERIDPETGEVFNRKPEFTKMSLKPGIGARWFEAYQSDVYPGDYVVMRGQKMRPPRYYDRLFAKDNPFEWDEIQYRRELDGRSRAADNTPERLAAKEMVAKARLTKLKRGLE